MSYLTDRVEIVELVARLAWALDERRFDDLRTVYAADAEISSPRGNFAGIDEIVDFVRRASPEEELTQHLNTDVLVDLDGDRADVRAHQLVYFFHEGEAPYRTAGIQARFAAVRTPAGWRFARAQISPLWQHHS